MPSGLEIADVPPLKASLAGLPLQPPGGVKQTAKRALEILLEKSSQFRLPSALEREALAIAFARKRKVIYGAAFDVVRLSRELDLTDPDATTANLDAVELLEVKSTSRANMKSDFRGYFFALTTAELLVAQSLGTQYKFAFVNTITREHVELSLRDVFGRARGIYPTWSIQF